MDTILKLLKTINVNFKIITKLFIFFYIENHLQFAFLQRNFFRFSEVGFVLQFLNFHKNTINFSIFCQNIVVQVPTNVKDVQHILPIFNMFELIWTII